MSARLKKGISLRLVLDGYGRVGECLSRYEGTRVFVFGGITGEEVITEVISSRRGYIAARVIEVINSSPDRGSIECPYFGLCTGCQWQHISYERQLELKRGLVVRAMSEDGGMADIPVKDIVPAGQRFNYRNHARFTVGEGGMLGYVNRESRQFIRVEYCLLMHRWINDAIATLQGQCMETTQVSVRYGINTGEWLIQPCMNSVTGLEVGQKYFTESLYTRRFRISSSSFFQVNTLQAEKMIAIVKESLDLQGDEIVVDAYAGVGTYSVMLAPYAARIYAVEEAASAIADAQENFKGLDNILPIKARTGDFLESFTDRIDALILNPSRSGCQPEVIKALNLNPPDRIIYVSCNPRTLARDLRLLCTGSFTVEQVAPIDLFPNTVQVENVATLRRRYGK